MSRQFAMGAIYALPIGISVPASARTPIPIAILKDATVDFKQAKKVLHGQWVGAIDIGAGPLEITAKIKSADFRAATLTALLQGATSASGATLGLFGEAVTIPATPYQITAAQSASYVEDGGVLDLTTGLWLTNIGFGSGSASTPNPLPTTGQYYVNPATGIYTFAAADTTHNLSIVYSYKPTGGSAVGQVITFNNIVMGVSTGFLLRVYNTFKIGPTGTIRPLGFDFPNFHFDNLSAGLKSEDWAEQDLAGMAVQDITSTNLFKAYTGE